MFPTSTLLSSDARLAMHKPLVEDSPGDEQARSNCGDEREISALMHAVSMFMNLSTHGCIFEVFARITQVGTLSL